MADDAPYSQRPPSRWRRVQRLLGVAAVAVLVLAAFTTAVRVVALPVVLALFPAALLAPAQSWLVRRGVPAALAALLLATGILSGIVVAVAVAVPMMVAELPRLFDSMAVALRDIMNTIDGMPLGVQVAGIDALLERAEGLVRAGGGPVDQATAALEVAGEVLAGAILLVVLLFFYLKDGGRIAAGLHGALPTHWRQHAAALGERIWATLGAFFRGQLLIAFVDAFFIGLGLLLLGVPLALPLAFLVFLGGLLPIVGAVATGAIAVLVALADGGLWVGVAVLVLVVGVQQLESNVLQPVVMGRMTAVHPLVVIVSVTLGWVLLGVIGAFLAVPVAACASRVFDYLRETSPLWRQETTTPSGSSRQASPSAEASTT